MQFDFSDADYALEQAQLEAGMFAQSPEDLLIEVEDLAEYDEDMALELYISRH